MKTCWSCRGGAGEGAFCGVCGVIQPPDPQQNLFEVLSLPAGFAVDRPALEVGYRQAQQQFHPDRFVTRSATERRFSAEHVTRLNEAYQTLGDPLKRATYLLRLLGVEKTEAPQDPDFLMEVMESREALAEIDPRSREAAARIDRFRQRVASSEAGEVAALAVCLANFPDVSGPQVQEGQKLASRLRYHRRFLEELEELEERMLR